MSTLADLKLVLTELETFRKQATTMRVQCVLDKEIKVVQAEVQQVESAQKKTSDPAPMDTDAAPPAANGGAPLKIPTDITNYGWDQSAKFVKVYLTVKECGAGFAAEHCKLQVQDRQFSVMISCPSGKLYRLSVGSLGGSITPDGSIVKAKPDGSVTVSLKKADTTTWENLKKKEERIKTPNLGKDEDPQQGLMNLMKNMYDEGDDEMKRTISKAFYESQTGKKPSMPDDDFGTM